MIICAALREGWTCSLELPPLLDLRDETSACCKADLRAGTSACGKVEPPVEASACGTVYCGEWDLGVGGRGGEEITAGSAGPFSLPAC